MNWLDFPCVGTSVLDGQWITTILRADGTKEVAVLSRELGEWKRISGSRRNVPLERGSQVVAISHPPAPAREYETLDVWYDRRQRLWYAARKDQDDNQVGRAGAGPSRRDAIADAVYLASLTGLPRREDRGIWPRFRSDPA